MTKQEKIREAYGEDWSKVKNFVDSDGFIDANDSGGVLGRFMEDELETKIYQESDIGFKTTLFRPISLKGI